MSATTRVSATVKVSGQEITLEDLEDLVKRARGQGAPGNTKVQVTEGKAYPYEAGRPPHSLALTFEVSA